MNDISVELKAVRQAYIAEEAKDKKKEMMVEKKGQPT